MAASVEELSFQLTSDALAEQERTLHALRARAGTIVAAASISGSFLGAKVGHGSLGGWGIAALATASRILLAFEVVLWTISITS